MTFTIHRRLSQMQLVYLEHIRQFGVTEYIVLQLLENGASRNQITKRLSRMHRHELVVKIRVGGRVMFLLGRMAQRYIDVPERLLRSPGPQVMAEQRAVLHYCWLGPRRLQRLTPENLLSRWPNFPQSALHAPYYVDPKGFLGQIRLISEKARPSRVATETHEFIAGRVGLGEPFSQLIAGGEFLLVLLTHDKGQTEAVRRAVKAHGKWDVVHGAPPVAVRVHQLPSIEGIKYVEAPNGEAEGDDD